MNSSLRDRWMMVTVCLYAGNLQEVEGEKWLVGVEFVTWEVCFWADSLEGRFECVPNNKTLKVDAWEFFYDQAGFMSSCSRIAERGRINEKREGAPVSLLHGDSVAFAVRRRDVDWCLIPTKPCGSIVANEWSEYNYRIGRAHPIRYIY